MPLEPLARHLSPVVISSPDSSSENRSSPFRALDRHLSNNTTLFGSIRATRKTLDFHGFHAQDSTLIALA